MAENRRHDMGSEVFCICPKCAEKTPNHRGIRCQDEKCPECGAKLLREDSYHHQLFEEKKAKKNNEP